jgi:hypothetical protein
VAAGQCLMRQGPGLHRQRQHARNAFIAQTVCNTPYISGFC